MGINASQASHGYAGKHPKKLIEAVVDCIYSDAPPPAELRLAWQCQRWNCLPEVGAYLDQDYYLMTCMTGLANIHSTVSRWTTLQGKRIHTLTDSERKILRTLKDLGVMF